MPDMSQASCSECNRPISDQFVMRVGDSILHEQCLRYPLVLIRLILILICVVIKVMNRPQVFHMRRLSDGELLQQVWPVLLPPRLLHPLRTALLGLPVSV